MFYAEHIKCECGGVIWQYDSTGHLRCELCGLEYSLHELDYDLPVINDKTGWIFPMKYRNEVE